MKSKTKNIYVLKIVFIALFAMILMFFFFSNFGKIKSSNDAYQNSIMDKDQTWNKSLFDFPMQFEKIFSKDFLQRDLFLRLYDNYYFLLFDESSSTSFYLTSPQKTKLAFLSRHPSEERSIRYSLFFAQLNSGYGDADKNVDSNKDIFSKNMDFLEKNNTPTLIVTFPPKPLLNFDQLPYFIQSSVGYQAYENPIEERIFNVLPEKFRNKYILNLFSLAIIENEKTPLFPQHNFHWEERSYYTNLVASQIAKRFNIPDSRSLKIQDYKLFDIKSDMWYLTSISLEKTSFLLYPQSKFDTLGVVSLSASHHKNTNKKGKILVIGDSFAPRIVKDLARYFGEVRVYSNNDFNQKNINFVYEEYKPDYIVFIHHRGLVAISKMLNKYEMFYEKAMSINTQKKMK